MTYQPQSRTGQNRGGYEDRQPTPIDTSKVLFKNIASDLFDDVARKAAEKIAENKNSNKPTQLRRFYDEIVMWENKASLNPSKFPEYLPFVRMINAKAAYARGRKLIDDNYVKLIADCLKQVETTNDLRHFKLFMEAFMGFYKEKRPKD
ncbi:MAG: type III-A CRISPR-associated protein Csm2 [Nitrosomonas ureae]